MPTTAPRWREFEDARELVRGLHLLDEGEWFAFSRGDLARLLGRRPADIPSSPDTIFRDRGWPGWTAFLRGTARK
ncbi:MAG: hypothetical protein K8T90_09005 [Planctomycetes bacterium]|nr:hypothetical protein [Planctomycetota bacterium]